MNIVLGTIIIGEDRLDFSGINSWLRMEILVKNQIDEVGS